MAEAKQIVFQNPDSLVNQARAVRWMISRAISQLTGLTGTAVPLDKDHLVRCHIPRDQLPRQS